MAGDRARGKVEAMTEHREKTLYRYRLATSHDESAILDALMEVAPEIPVMTHDGRQERLLQTIKRTTSVYGVTWIALDRDNRVVGFLLAESKGDRFDLPYGGVRKGHRGNDIFPNLVKKVMAKGLSLTAVVLHANASKKIVVGILEDLGFEKVTPSNGVNNGDNFRWSPAPSDTQGGTLS